MLVENEYRNVRHVLLGKTIKHVIKFRCLIYDAAVVQKRQPSKFIRRRTFVTEICLFLICSSGDERNEFVQLNCIAIYIFY